MSRIASREPATPPLTGRLSRSDVLWVANTAHGPGGHWHARVRGSEPDHDHLAAADAALRYLVDHRVPTPPEPPDGRALAELAIIREVVQRLAEPRPEPRGEPWTDESRALLDGSTYAIDGGGRIASTEVGWRGFCRDLLLPLVALIVEDRELHRCANPACRLLFDDASRSHTRRWCDTAGCGNRDRVRRARGGPGLVVTADAPGAAVAG